MTPCWAGVSDPPVDSLKKSFRRCSFGVEDAMVSFLPNLPLRLAEPTNSKTPPQEHREDPRRNSSSVNRNTESHMAPHIITKYLCLETMHRPQKPLEKSTHPYMKRRGFTKGEGGSFHDLSWLLSIFFFWKRMSRRALKHVLDQDYTITSQVYIRRF